jgi:hypothetical protein
VTSNSSTFAQLRRPGRSTFSTTFAIVNHTNHLSAF